MPTQTGFGGAVLTFEARDHAAASSGSLGPAGCRRRLVAVGLRRGGRGRRLVDPAPRRDPNG